MILLQSRYQRELDGMIQYVEKRAFNSYVRQFVEYPTMDLFQLHFTYLFLTSKGYAPECKETLCISQLLIQLGLDSHEQVKLTQVEGEQIRNRQLTILSGDYFSGYYYLFLAEREQVELINKWATAIQQINELKAALHYQQTILSETEVMEKKHTIQGKLTTSVLDWYEASEEWYTLHALLLKLLAVNDDQLFGLKDSDPLLNQVQQKIGQIADKDIADELLLWVQHIHQNMLVIEP